MAKQGRPSREIKIYENRSAQKGKIHTRVNYFRLSEQNKKPIVIIDLRLRTATCRCQPAEDNMGYVGSHTRYAQMRLPTIE